LSESPERLTAHARANREYWDREADAYQGRNAEFISRDELHWGMWQRPDSELGILGDVTGKDVLELGCGAAQCGIVLARAGARVTGIDNSARQLEHARREVEGARVGMELHHGSAEALPFGDESFDVVFADHGANRFADPFRWVPEAARVLRPDGLLAFSGGTAFEAICFDEPTDTWDARLHRPYFGLHRVSFGDDGAVEFELPYGEWIRLFRRSGFVVEALVEVQPPEGARSTYRNEAETAWARRWPMEQIWKVRKERS
jgi:ubiquinone/menaquinone biosynthesis C-methylase UbiE